MSDGHIKKRENTYDKSDTTYIDQVDSTIYLYDFKTNTSRELSYEEASRLVISSRNTSPNGFTITQGSSGGGIWPLYYSSDYDSFYATGNGISKKLDIDVNYYDFRFLGWVE